MKFYNWKKLKLQFKARINGKKIYAFPKIYLRSA